MVKYDDVTYTDHLFIIDAWTDTPEKKQTLLDCISKLREFNIQILLATHYPVEPEVQQLVDYYIYDKKNPLLKHADFESYELGSGRWTKFDNMTVENDYEFHHDYAIWETMRNAFHFAKYLGKKYIHFMEYDNVVETFQYRQAFVEEVMRHEAVIYEYHKGSSIDFHLGAYMATYIFSIRTDLALKVVNSVHNIRQYFYHRPNGWQLERVFLQHLRENTSDIFVSKYIDNTKGINKHAVWNRDGIDRGDAKFQVYPALDYNNDLHLHLISGYHEEPAEIDYELEIRYAGTGRFYTLKKGDLVVEKLGRYVQGDKIQVLYNGIEVYCEHLTKTVEDFKKLNRLVKTTEPSEVKIISHFVGGAFCEILGDGIGDYSISFIDQDQSRERFRSNINLNCWSKTAIEYFVNWKTVVFNSKGNVIYQHKQDLKDQKVLISSESSSLGDTLAWVPVVDQFRKKHGCKVVLSTFWNSLFEKEYPEIEFVKPGTTVDNIYASYTLGIFLDSEKNVNYAKHPNNPRPLNLQAIACDILGLEYNEERPKITFPDKGKTIEGDYICIGPHGTALAKYWNRPGGWQEVIDWANAQRLKVVYISKESLSSDWDNSKLGGKLENVIDKSGDFSLEDRINDLRHAKAFIGISSGLSWLAWACETPTVLISGFTDEHLEFSDCQRVINKDVCHGCWANHKFDPGDWQWCPEHKDTDRHFECTKTIKPTQVIEALRMAI